MCQASSLGLQQREKGTRRLSPIPGINMLSFDVHYGWEKAEEDEGKSFPSDQEELL